MREGKKEEGKRRKKKKWMTARDLEDSGWEGNRKRRWQEIGSRWEGWQLGFWWGGRGGDKIGRGEGGAVAKYWKRMEGAAARLE